MARLTSAHSAADSDRFHVAGEVNAWPIGSGMFRQEIQFIREAVGEFRTTGAVLPTARWVAGALTRPLREREPHRPLRILELGAGNGSVTLRIFRHMGPRDEFMICELNPRFMRALQHRLHHQPVFHAHDARVQFFTGAAQDLPDQAPYDAIICGIPLLNFDLPTVRAIFDKVRQLSLPRAMFTYYQYIGLRSVNKVVSGRDGRKRMRELEGFFHEFLTSHPVRQERIWLNVPPATVYAVEMRPRAPRP